MKTRFSILFVWLTSLSTFTSALCIPDPADNTSPTTTSVQAPSAVLDAGATPSVSRAGGVLNAAAAEEANPVDNTAVRAISGANIKSSSGQCLTVNRFAGDFRENLIPVTLEACNGGQGQQWDFLTSGKHNNVPGTALIVSSLTQGCLNFDSRRAAGDTVIIFSCGGRANGEGQVATSQLFPFTQGTRSLALVPQNANSQTCLLPNSGKLDSGPCTDGPDQLFTIG